MSSTTPCSNANPCECPYTDCKNHGRCCQCVAYHKGQKELPICLRDMDGEKK